MLSKLACRSTSVEVQLIGGRRPDPISWRRVERCSLGATPQSSLSTPLLLAATSGHNNYGFSSDEEMEAKDLFKAAREFDRLDGPALAAAAIEFAKKCHTGIGSQLNSALTAFKAGRIPTIRKNTKHPAAVRALIELATGEPRHALAAAFDQLDHLPGCRIYRPEVWHEMRSAARFFSTGEAESREDAAWRMRDRPRRRGKKLPRAVVSRTLLVKGMESDHGLVLDAEQLADRQNFYVAVTRASHSLTIFSDNPVNSFADP